MKPSLGTELYYYDGSTLRKAVNCTDIQPPKEGRKTRVRTCLTDDTDKEQPTFMEYGDASFTADFGGDVTTMQAHMRDNKELEFIVGLGEGGAATTGNMNNLPTNRDWVRFTGFITSLQLSAPTVDDGIYYTISIKCTSGLTIEVAV